MTCSYAVVALAIVCIANTASAGPSEAPGVWLYSEPDGGGGRFFVPQSWLPFDICHRRGMRFPHDRAKFFTRNGVVSTDPIWDPQRGSLVRSARVAGNCSNLLYTAYCFQCWHYSASKKRGALLGTFASSSGVVNTGNWYDGLHHIEASEGGCGRISGHPAASGVRFVV